MEQMRVVRLNARKFPPTEFETARLAHHGIQTEPFEPAHEEVSAAEIEALRGSGRPIDGLMITSAKLQAAAIEQLAEAGCRVVTRMGTGCDKIDIDALQRHGIVLANVPEFCTEEMADHTFALLLSLVRSKKFSKKELDRFRSIIDEETEGRARRKR